MLIAWFLTWHHFGEIASNEFGPVFEFIENMFSNRVQQHRIANHVWWEKGYFVVVGLCQHYCLLHVFFFCRLDLLQPFVSPASLLDALW